MAASPKKQTRPTTVPVPIRFTEKMLQEVEEVAEMFEISRQDVIRLSVAAGLKSLRRMGLNGLAEAVADQFPNSKQDEK